MLKGKASIVSKELIALSKLLVPTADKPIAVVVIIIPQNSLCFLDGFSFPLSLNIPRTKIAESTEFIIETKTNIIAIKIVTTDNG